ncbi:MAG: PAS domain-containing sensor histidine kinase [Pseudomonadota bacterium]|uniref:sensor histidine kinase NtrY-like n=1 Tax=unclassified Phenylobacterium TaxID=2640670 RepID=UPI0006F8A303|nr:MULTISPECIES: PAS domain-containing sensor histidine kinase [unclassified Phenylobacterium]KRB44501.1 PAS domain-containing sensor histidine kinase [Phenylobacterium sp. Root700]MBT9473143.1 PAS domain-containing sensor histidine kinase [Phenylobacterium sp.]
MASQVHDGGTQVAPAARIWRALQSRYVLGGGYALAAFLTAIAILLAASPPETGPLAPASKNILAVLAFNLVLILALAAQVGWQIVALLRARSSDAAARLHLRFVTLFALAAVAPAMVVALFYTVLVNRGVENWFSERVQTVVENSATVMRSYVEDQTRFVEEHVFLMAQDLNRAAPALQASPVTFSHFLGYQASYHAFPAAYLIDREGRILARAEAVDAPKFVAPPQSGFAAVDEDAVIFVSTDLTRALYKLSAYPDAYLYVTRPVQKGIVTQLQDASNSVTAYREAAESRQRIQRVFALSYMETAMLVLVGAVWLGMGAARAISAPVGRLVQAAGRVAGGDLDVRLDADRDPDELAVLSRAFNSMTHDLQAQQAALKRAGDEAEERRQFIETVLSEVSAGVIGLDADGRVSAINRQAIALLDLTSGEIHGRKLAEVAPELVVIAEHGDIAGEAEEEVDVVRSRETHRLRVRASRSEGGLVLTFDDITRLVSAQRNAAWRDVARRIAHEIKNPLTPIQLSAERLRRKFRKDVAEEDLETFDRCTDTIVRQVDGIGRMVDEFSSFARMPAPKFADQDGAELLRAAVFAQRVASPDISVELAEPVPEVTLVADGRMLTQALTNVLKNAAEAVSARTGASPDPKGRIVARLMSDDQGVQIEIEDNGVGLPDKDRDRLTEPYVTTREKGTGLGLAIVKRILEDHGGELILTDSVQGQGARAILKLPTTARAKSLTASEPSQDRAQDAGVM